MDLLVASQQERSLAVWAEIALHMDSYLRLFAHDPWYPLLRRFVTELFLPVHWRVEQSLASSDRTTDANFQVRTLPARRGGPARSDGW